MNIHSTSFELTRRDTLQRMGTGMGVLGLAGILAQDGSLASAAPASASPLAPKPSHFAPKAKHIIHLFMNGGPSQVDTFDPKPALKKYNGQRPPAADLKTERKTGGLLMSPIQLPISPSVYGFRPTIPANQDIHRPSQSTMLRGMTIPSRFKPVEEIQEIGSCITTIRTALEPLIQRFGSTWLPHLKTTV